MEKKEIIKVEVVSGERIDSFLAKRLDLTRTRVQELIKSEQVKVNNKKVKSSYKIEENDEIEVIIPEIEEVEIMPENIKIDIVFEDKDIAIINKQAGLVVDPGEPIEL